MDLRYVQVLGYVYCYFFGIINGYNCVFSLTDRQIMEDLMAHETKSSSSSSVPSSFPLSSLSMPSSYPDDSEERAQYSSSYSSGDEEEAEGGNVGGASSVSYMGAGGGSGFEEVEEFEESSDEEEFTVRVSKVVCFIKGILRDTCY